MKCNQCQIELISYSNMDGSYKVCPKCNGKIEDFRSLVRDSLTYIPPSLNEARKQRNFYKAQTCCLNCGWSGTLEKERGQRVKGTPCPNCDCKLGMEE